MKKRTREKKQVQAYHVRIVPMTRTGIGNDGVLVVAIVVDDRGH